MNIIDQKNIISKNNIIRDFVINHDGNIQWHDNILNLIDWLEIKFFYLFEIRGNYVIVRDKLQFIKSINDFRPLAKIEKITKIEALFEAAFYTVELTNKRHSEAISM